MPTTDFITVVSGVPRSGTSLMMQMLAAGGIAPLTDAQRSADASNPRGYFELEAVKRLKHDKTWLPDALGKAVKVIHLLLPELAAPDLGQGLKFRVILMRRPLEEVVASQRAMLKRLGRPAATVSDAQLGDLFAKQRERAERSVAGHPMFETLAVDYPALLANPAEGAFAVSAFLGGGLDEAGMAREVDASLYREKR